MTPRPYPRIALVLRLVHEGELRLEKEFHAVADRHRTDHEVRHVAVDLARWSKQNREALAPLAARYGNVLAEDLEAQTPVRPLEALREAVADLLGHHPASGLLLLRDLRQLYLLASGNSVLWTMLEQAAKQSRDAELLDAVMVCHERTVRQAVWCNAMIKTLSPQVLTAA